SLDSIFLRQRIYSLGASLYHLATGSPPHDGKNVCEILTKAVDEPFPNPQLLRADLSRNVSDIIRKLGAKSLDERYADAQQLIEDVELVKMGRPPICARYRSSAELMAATANRLPRVLLIDDDPLARGLFGAVLRKRGWAIEVAEDGKRGIEAALLVDVVVVDLVLPDIGGDEVVRRIQAQQPELPIVIMTNAFSPEQMRLAQASGAKEVLDKAATNPSLLAVILAALVRRSPVAPLREEALSATVMGAADAALARMLLLIQRMTEQGDKPTLLEDVVAAARGLSLAATEGRRPLAASLAGAIEQLARQLIAFPDRRSRSTRHTLQRAVESMRPILLGDVAQLGPGLALVVDDDPTSRLLACNALAKVGVRHKAVDSPSAALAYLQRESCDVLLSDVVMGGGGGFQLAAEVRKLPGNERLPVIFVTGITDFAQFFNANEAAESDLLCKPYLLTELGAKAMIMLARRANALSQAANSGITIELP
ncbi:MAG: response regulator, partial [Planctomycetota bacterium]